MLAVVPGFDARYSGWGPVSVVVAAGTLMPSQGAKRLGEVRQQETVDTSNHQLMTWLLSHQEIAEKSLAAVAAVLAKHLQARSQFVNIGDGMREGLKCCL